MQRYFLQTAFNENNRASITGEDVKHIVKVMRMGTGDRCIVVSEGVAYEANITEQHPDEVIVERVGEALPSNELPIHVTLACGLPKGDKLDLIVQKGTELGMAALLPFEAKRSIVKWDEKKGTKKVERLTKIAKEAAEQCHRSHIPTIFSPISFAHLVKEAEKYDVCFVADEEVAKNGKSEKTVEQFQNVDHGKTVLAVFGPEGGLSREEVEQLVDAGFHSISLGPRILRTETAPLYFLSAMSYEFE